MNFMWWVLLAVLILILFENKNSFRDKIRNLLKPKVYFWIFFNFIVLSFVISHSVPKLVSFLDILPVSPVLNLLPYSVFLQFLIFLIIIDFMKFAVHYLMHRFDFLWKFHLIHHSSKEINTLATFKHSWVEALINLFFSCLIQKFFNVDLYVLSTANAVLIYLCIWQHTKLRYLELPMLNSVFVTPKLHRIHHEFQNSSQHSNYGLLFNFWDRVFRTFDEKEKAEAVYGINEPGYPYSSDLKQFFYPFSK